MKDFAVEKLRNVCLMSHGGAGKTTLAEAMLFNTGVLDRFGKVADGTTTTDYDPEEIKRKISISAAIAPCEWKDCKINVIDTPGYFDFVGEVKQGIRVAEGSLILVSAKSGVAVGTEKAWAYSKEQGISKMFFINKMDDENADFNKVLNQLTDTFGKGVIAFQLPIIENEKFTGFIDVINMTAKKFEKDKLADIPVPSSMNSKIAEIRDALNEAIAETDEQLMEKFFGGEEFTHEEIVKGIMLGVSDGSIAPVFCGSAMNNLGVQFVMDAILEYLPAPNFKKTIKALKAGTDTEIELRTAPDEALSA